MGNPSVRFDEGRGSVGHWPSGLSIRPLLPTLRTKGEEGRGDVAPAPKVGMARCAVTVVERPARRSFSGGWERQTTESVWDVILKDA
jgi:hypothetical protein